MADIAVPRVVDDEVPPHLRLVESFANSLDVETAQDDLDSAARFGRWLAAHGFPPPQGHPTAAELDLALGLRGALRDSFVAHHDGEDATDARSRLDAYAARVPLRAVFGAGPAGLAPVGEGVTAMLGAVLGAIVLAEQDGTWRRLKICREDTCRSVFYDRSKNSSKAWCSMRLCGNRNKTRAYRGRLKDGDGD
jgi:predicted RNA-binding Zn ribbon-like protein